MITFLKKLDIKKVNRKQLIVIFLIGILLVVISIPTDNQTDEEQEVISNDDFVADWNDEYQEKMESQLEEMLLEVSGVGNVKVMITLESSSELIVEKDHTLEPEESVEETVYIDTDNGKSPYVKQEHYPVIEGVLVIASGGDNPVIIANVTEAIQALFEVDTHKIKIMKMK